MFQNLMRYCSNTGRTFKKSQWTLISYPFAGGQPKDGPQNAPSFLIDMIANKKPKIQHSYAVAIPETQQKSNLDSKIEDNIKNARNVAQWSNALYNLNSLAFNQSQESRVLTIGGDHSMGVATVAASLAKHPDLQVLWIDAHADINSPRHSPTKNAHGMPVSFLTGLSQHASFAFVNSAPRQLPFSSLHFVGIRDLDQFEVENVEKYKIGVTSVDKFNALKNPSDFADLLKDEIKLNPDKPVHVSFDVDCLDPAFMPCTGTVVDDGLELGKVLEFLKVLGENYNVVSMDITEVNYELGTMSDKELSRDTVEKVLQTVMSM